MPGRTPTCVCGECRRCIARTYRKRFYQRHADRVRLQSANFRARQKELQREASDEELDRRAIARWRPEWGSV